MFGLTRKERNDEVWKSITQMDVGRLRKALARGGDPNCTDHDGNDFPMLRAARGYEHSTSAAMIQLLLEGGAHVDMMTEDRETAMHTLARAGNLDAMKIIAEAGGDLHAPDGKGNTPLVWALRQGSWDVAAELLRDEECPLDVNKQNETPLVVALRRSDVPVSIVKSMLEKGVDRNVATTSARETALHVAAAQGHTRVLTLLLGTPGIHTHPLNSSGQTPLWLAVKNGKHEAVDELVLFGANDVHTADNKGMKPLYLAAEGGSIRMLKALFAAAKSKNIPFSQGDLDKALLLASSRGMERMAELLIAEGADVKAQDAEGRTPLMKAAMGGSVELLNVLIRAGAATDTADNHGLTAYDHAVSGKQEKARDILGRHKTVVPKALSCAPEAAVQSRFTRLDEHSIEVRESGGLTMVFNFWTQQVHYRDAENGHIVDIRNFADVQRQEAIEEAWQSLVAQKGNPPELKTGQIRKGQNPLAAK